MDIGIELQQRIEAEGFEMDEQIYTINKRTSKKYAKCATCRKDLSEGSIQATTEGPDRTIQKSKNVITDGGLIVFQFSCFKFIFSNMTPVVCTK